jgi:hypothetical protein
MSGETARLFSVGDVVWALATDWQSDGSLRAVDVANPAQPRSRGSVAVPRGVAAGGWWWGGMSDAVQVGNFLAVHQRSYYWRYDGSGCGDECLPRVLVYDLSNPDAPALAESIAIPGASWLGGLVASGSSIWAVHYEWVEDGQWSHVRFFADRIDLSGGTPRLAASVNIPGMLLAATDDGRLYTWETVWPDSRGGIGGAEVASAARPTTWIHALALTSRGTASLLASRELPGYASAFAVDGGFAYGLLTDWDTGWSNARTELAAVALDGLRVISRQAVSSGWANLVTATSGKVFLQSGWPAQELLVYGARESGPVFEQAIPAPGWPSDVEVAGAKAYVATGPYGVTVIPLGGVSSPP